VVEHILLVSVVLAALVAPSAAAPATVVVLKANLAGKYLGTTSTGSGTATITFTGSKVCWKFTYRGLDTRGLGHPRRPSPAPGKHKTSAFPLTATTSMTPGCVAADHWGPSSAGWAKKVAADPARFYVIIGTVKYPQGAIGGTLHRP
jgi:CHRD domain